MSSPPARNRLTIAAIAGLTLLCAGFWADCLFGPSTPMAARFQARMEPWLSEADLPDTDRQWTPLLWDSVAQFYPWRLLAARAWRSGEMALWNPHQFCGYPFVANGQSALFYPPNWLLALVDVRWGMGLLLALHFAAAAVLTFLFCRRIGLDHLPACLSAVAFTFGGFMVTWCELPTLVNALTWLPGALLGIALVFEGDRRGVPVLAAAIALALLAGHFQISAYVCLAALLYAACRALWEAVNRRPARLPALLLAFSLGGLLSGAQVLPTLELGENSSRGSRRPTEAGLQFHLARVIQPEEAVILLRPDAYGNPSRGDHILVRYGLPYAEHCGFVGIVTVVLALGGLFFARTRHYAFFMVLAAATLSVAMGGPLARAMYWGIPGLALAGSFTRVLSVYTFALAVAAGLGLQAISASLRARAEGESGRRERSGYRAGAVLCAVSLCVLLVELLPWAYDYLPKARREHVYAPTPTTDRLTRAPGRVLAVTPRRAWSMLHAPHALLPPNAATVYGYDSISGYDSLLPEAYRRFVAQAEGGEPSPAVNGNMLLLMGVDSPLYELAGLSVVATMDPQGGGVTVAERGQALPRAFVAPDGPRWEAAVADEPECAVPGPATRDTVRDVRPAHYRREGPSTILVEDLDTHGPAPWLIVTETSYPGWNAYVGEQRREVVCVARTFCGVPLSEGDARARLVFEPFSVRLGVFLTLVALGALAGCCAATWPGRRLPPGGSD